MFVMRRFLEIILLHLLIHHCSLAQQALVEQEGNTTSKQDGRVWDVVIATCDEPGAGTDASVYLKIYYESAHEYETFNLDNPGRDDFERGAKDHFKLFFKQGDIINMGLFWWPGFTFSQSWCAKWVLLLNSDTETCFEGIFNKWILHYKDPPTYATRFHKLRFADCVAPGDAKAPRRSYMRYEDRVGAY
ncbi:hypothetical protein Aduo_014771 [Ancylostoma duodenale]